MVANACSAQSPSAAVAPGLPAHLFAKEGYLVMKFSGLATMSSLALKEAGMRYSKKT